MNLPIRVSGANGGDLGRAPRALRAGVRESRRGPAGRAVQPVLTQFGHHLIRVDSRSGDTTALYHLLLRIQPSDSSGGEGRSRGGPPLREAGGRGATSLRSPPRPPRSSGSRSRCAGHRRASPRATKPVHPERERLGVQRAAGRSATCSTPRTATTSRNSIRSLPEARPSRP